MKLQEVKVKKRFKFENLGFILLIISVIFAFISMIYFMNGAQNEWSNTAAKICLSCFASAWFMINYGQYAKKHKKFIIKVIQTEDYQTRKTY